MLNGNEPIRILQERVAELEEALTACAQSLLWLHGNRDLAEWVDEKGVKQDPCGIRKNYRKAQNVLASGQTRGGD